MTEHTDNKANIASNYRDTSKTIITDADRKLFKETLERGVFMINEYGAYKNFQQKIGPDGKVIKYHLPIDLDNGTIDTLDSGIPKVLTDIPLYLIREKLGLPQSKKG